MDNFAIYVIVGLVASCAMSLFTIQSKLNDIKIEVKSIREHLFNSFKE